MAWRRGLGTPICSWAGPALQECKSLRQYVAIFQSSESIQSLTQNLQWFPTAILRTTKIPSTLTRARGIRPGGPYPYAPAHSFLPSSLPKWPSGIHLCHAAFGSLLSPSRTLSSHRPVLLTRSRPLVVLASATALTFSHCAPGSRIPALKLPGQERRQFCSP